MPETNEPRAAGGEASADNLKVPCGYCKGDGYTAEHDSPSNHSPEDGSCISCPVQAQCEYCHATGWVVPLDSVEAALQAREDEATARERAKAAEMLDAIWQVWMFSHRCFNTKIEGATSSPCECCADFTERLNTLYDKYRPLVASLTAPSG